MKTIVERAYDYADEKWGDIDEYHADSVAVSAYIAGAEEQKAIDDAKLLKLKSSWEREAQINHDAEMHYKQGYHDASEKFRGWLKNNWREYVYQDGDGIIHFGHWESDFRKTMEE